MKRNLIILLLLVPLAAFARLGETRPQCEQRYGKPVAILDDRAVVFRKDEVVITTYFDSSNRVEWIEYRAPDLSLSVIEHLLQVSAPEPWEKIDRQHFHAEKARLTAIAVPHEFVRISPDNWEVRKAARNELQQKEVHQFQVSKQIDLDGF